MMKQSGTPALAGFARSLAVCTPSSQTNHNSVAVPKCRRVQSATKIEYRFFRCSVSDSPSPLLVVPSSESAETHNFTPRNSSPTPSPSSSRDMKQGDTSRNSQSTPQSDSIHMQNTTHRYRANQDNQNGSSSSRRESHDDVFSDFAAIVRHFEYHALKPFTPPPCRPRSPLIVPAIAPKVTAFESAINSDQQPQSTDIHKPRNTNSDIIPSVDISVEAEPIIVGKTNDNHSDVHSEEFNVSAGSSGTTGVEERNSITSTSDDDEPKLTEGPVETILNELSNNSTDSNYSSSTVIRDYNREAVIQRSAASFSPPTPNLQKHEINVSTVATERHRPYHCQPPTQSSLPDRSEGVFTRSSPAKLVRLSWTKTLQAQSASSKTQGNSDGSNLHCNSKEICSSLASVGMPHDPVTKSPSSLPSTFPERVNINSVQSENSHLSLDQHDNFWPHMSAKYGPLGSPVVSNPRFSEPGSNRGFTLVPAPPARPVSARAPSVTPTPSVATVFGVECTAGLNDNNSLHTIAECTETRNYTHSSTRGSRLLPTDSYPSALQNACSLNDECHAYSSSEEDISHFCETSDALSVKSPSQSSIRAYSAFETTVNDLHGDDFCDIDEMMEADLLFETGASTGHTTVVPDQGDDVHEVLRRFSGAAHNTDSDYHGSERTDCRANSLEDELDTEGISANPSASCPVVAESRGGLPLIVTPSVPYIRPSATTTAPLSSSSDLEMRSGDSTVSIDPTFPANDSIPLITGSQNIHHDNEAVTESGATYHEEASSVGSFGLLDDTPSMEACSVPPEAKSHSDLVTQDSDLNERHFSSIDDVSYSQTMPGSSSHHILVSKSTQQDTPFFEAGSHFEYAVDAVERRPSWSMVKEATKSLSVAADSTNALKSDSWDATRSSVSSVVKQDTTEASETSDHTYQSPSDQGDCEFRDAGLIATDESSFSCIAKNEANNQPGDISTDKPDALPTDTRHSSAVQKYSKILVSPPTQEKGSSVALWPTRLKMRSSLDSSMALSESTLRRKAADATAKFSRKSLTPTATINRRGSVDLMSVRSATAIPAPHKRVVQQNSSQQNPTLPLDRKPKGATRGLSDRTIDRRATSSTMSRLTPSASPRSTIGTSSRPTLGTQLRSSTGASPRPTPGASPRPTPGVSPRPTPGVSPRPTPGVSPRPTPGVSPRPSRSLSPTNASPRQSLMRVTTSSSLCKQTRLADKGNEDIEMLGHLTAPTDRRSEISSQQFCTDGAISNDNASRRLSSNGRTSTGKTSLQTATQDIGVEQALERLSLGENDNGSASMLENTGNNVSGVDKEVSPVIAPNTRKWQVIGSKDRIQTRQFSPLASATDLGNVHESEKVYINDPLCSSSGTPPEAPGSIDQPIRQTEVRPINTPGSGHRRAQSLTAPSGPTRRKMFVRAPMSASQAQSRLRASAKAVAVSSVRRILSFAPERRNPSNSGSLRPDVCSDSKTSHQSEDRKAAVAVTSLVPTGRRRRARVTVPRPFSLTGATLQQRTRLALEEARRRTEEVEKRRRVFRARPMPDFSKPFPPPKSSS